MIRVALKGLFGRKLRTLLTALAVILGVAMISGTYVLTDTIDAGFKTIFTGSYKGASAIVTAKVAFTNDQGPQSDALSFSQALLPRVRALPDVAAAAGSVTSQSARLVGRNGKTIQVGGAPNLGFSVDARENRFNPLSLVSGRWPSGSQEIAIDKATASSKHFEVGDSIGLAARGPVRRFRISGIAELASVASIGGATLAIFDLPTAQDVFGKRGQLDVIRVASRNGVDRKQLLREIGALLPPTAQVRDPDAQVKEDLKSVKFIGFVQKFLLVFGFIALFVGAFVIFNTLAITVAQRAREFATLRTIGATRGQVMRSVILEGVTIGALGSLIGLALGLALAKGLDRLFRVFGIDLPKGGTVFATRTVVVALVVGLLVTLFASLIPAFRATRVSPLAAVREGSTLPRGRFARFTPYAGVTLIVVGFALLLDGVFAHGKAFSERLLLIGPGVLLAFVGVALFSSKLVRPLAWALGWPAARASRFAGGMARENARRNPGRTASTAAALMIGLTLVTFVAVLGKGLRQSFEDSVRKQFTADYALTAQNNFSPFDSAPERAVAKVPGVVDTVGVRAGSGKAFGKVLNITAVPPNVGRAININWKVGDDTTPSKLGANGAFVDADYATKHQLRVGSPIRMETTTGTFLNLVVRGVFDPPNGGSPFGQLSISKDAFDAAYPQPEDLYAFVNVRGGASDEMTKRLEAALKPFPAVKVADRNAFIANQEKFINMLLNLLYVLLALSIVISLVGMVNTLVLSVYERTRELGMLRAIGTTRGQVGLMTIFESVVTALIGTSIGLVLGLVLARLVVEPLKSDGIVFAVPWGTLVFFVVAAIVTGILAALFPAWRASRLNVLEALQYE